MSPVRNSNFLKTLDAREAYKKKVSNGASLNELSLKDKNIFARYLSLAEHELAVYNFANIYIWRGIFDIRWSIIEENLCIFFQDKLGSFLYLGPLGKNLKPQAVNKIFNILDSFNTNRQICRIENVEENDLDFYRDCGYAVFKKPSDYLCLRQDLVQLKGDAFKSKRSSINYFLKHYHFQYLAFNERYRDDCLRLYGLWAEQRKKSRNDSLYQGMLEDSFETLKILLDNWRNLNCIGRIVSIDNQVKGFTFGFKLNKSTFCILYEITDLSVKGLAQFIFREFCAELNKYKYINVMDDSSLDNLKRVKLSYRPVKLIPAYIVKKRDE